MKTWNEPDDMRLGADPDATAYLGPEQVAALIASSADQPDGSAEDGSSVNTTVENAPSEIETAFGVAALSDESPSEAPYEFRISRTPAEIAAELCAVLTDAGADVVEANDSCIRARRPAVPDTGRRWGRRRGWRRTHRPAAQHMAVWIEPTESGPTLVRIEGRGLALANTVRDVLSTN